MLNARLRLFLAFFFPLSPSSVSIVCVFLLFVPKDTPSFSLLAFSCPRSLLLVLSPSPCIWFPLSVSFFSHTYSLLGVTLLAVCERGSSQGCKHILWEIGFQLCLRMCVCVCACHRCAFFAGRWGVFSPAVGTDSQVLERALQWAWRILLNVSVQPGFRHLLSMSCLCWVHTAPHTHTHTHTHTQPWGPVND